MHTYTLTLNGVTGINETMSALEARMGRGMSLDDQCEDRGFHVGSETRRALRKSIVDDCRILADLWDLFERAHLNGECEHKNCALNDLDTSEMMEKVSDKKREIQQIVDHAMQLDMEAGTEIVPDPAQPEDPMEILRRIIGYSQN